ncbi:MAG: phosphoribosylglycinamide formyltransferase [Burkholderiales bacterium]
MKRLVILISGRGSNLRAILETKLRAKVAAAISNNPKAAGLEIAAARGIKIHALDHKKFLDRESFDSELAEVIDSHSPDLVVLAGFMRILSNWFVNHYRGRLINIHPSLLPAFPGLNTHERALATGVKIHGATVHFVTNQLDHGPIIIQAAVPVLPGDTAESLAARVLEEEHRIYPQAIRWFLAGKLKLKDNSVIVERQTKISTKAMVIA